jgi:uncharacterized sulfatase
MDKNCSGRRAGRPTRRDVLRAGGLGLAAAMGARRMPAADATVPVAGGTKAAETSRPRPNVLWLIAEDICPDMACYGGQLVKTPNIDRLAARGIRFDNAFVTCPVCSPARSAFMTGMYQTTIGAHQHRTADPQFLPEGVMLVMDRFRAAGYFVTNGRFSHPAPGKGDNARRADKGQAPDAKAGQAGLTFTRGGKTDWNFKCRGKAFDGADWGDRKPGQAFFAQVNFDHTHRPFQRDPARPVDPDKIAVPPYYPDTPLSRRDWADYLESVQLLDGQVGEVLKRLDDEGLADSTIVLFVGDNGRPHVRGKQWLYEGGIHVPMIVRWPGHVQAGAVSDELVSAIDWPATLMNLAGLPVPKAMQGAAVLGPGAVRRDFVVAARDRCDETPDRIRCLRTKRHKYIRNFHPDRPYMQPNIYKKQHYPELTEMLVLKAEGKLADAQKPFMADSRPPEELYDLQADPHELNNLAGEEACKPILEDLRAKLDKWIRDTGDKGEIPEPPEAARNQREHMARLWQATAKSRNLPEDVSNADYLKWWKEHLLAK